MTFGFLEILGEVMRDLSRYDITHSIHGTGIFTYIYHKIQPNVGRYIILGWYG